MRLNPTTPSVHEIAKHKLKILQQMQQDFQRMFDHFVDTKRYRLQYEFKIYS